MIPNHYCGSAYDTDGSRCPNLYYHTGETGEKDSASGRPMKQYYVYCRRDGRLRSLGCIATWTGITPKDCPIRQKAEAQANERENG